MNTLHSIETILKIIKTNGSKPVLVHCNDFNDWVCKYDRDSRNLFNELLASSFAKLWNIPTPDIALVKIKKEHLPKDKTYLLQPRFFEKECFGSFYLENSKEIDESIISFIQHNKRRIANKEDFLKIALFDLWLCNEDRYQGNYNLLLCIDSEKLYFFYAIDHIQIFNNTHLEYDLVELAEDETIINSGIAKILFKNKKQTVEIVNNLVDNFYLCTQLSESLKK